MISADPRGGGCLPLRAKSGSPSHTAWGYPRQKLAPGGAVFQMTGGRT